LASLAKWQLTEVQKAEQGSPQLKVRACRVLPNDFGKLQLG
jgi:hypothetical protein